MPGQQAQHQGAQNVAFVRGIATAVFQRTRRYPALKYPGGSQELGKEDQLAVRRGRRTFIPAHVHSPAKRVYHLRLIGSYFELGKGSHLPTFVFTHWVSVPNLRKPAPVLDQRAFTSG